MCFKLECQDFVVTCQHNLWVKNKSLAAFLLIACTLKWAIMVMNCAKTGMKPETKDLLVAHLTNYTNADIFAQFFKIFI